MGNLLTYWKVWVLVLLVVGSLVSLGLKGGPSKGVEVVFISENSPAKDIIKQGSVITNFNGADITNLNDWLIETKDAKGEVDLIADGEEYKLKINNTLGLDVLDIQKLNLDMGLDLRGGTRVILKPKTEISAEIVENIKQTLQTRANLYGLKEIKFKTITDLAKNNYIQIEASGVGSDIVNNLLASTGKFEAKVTKPVYLAGEAGELQVGEKKYPVSATNQTILVDNKNLNPGDKFELDKIKFQYANRTDSTALFLADVYEGKDIELVYSDPQRSGVIPSGTNSYRFYFGVLVSQEGAERFAKVTADIPSIPDSSGELYLKDSEIIVYLDDKVVTNLRIGAELGGKPYTNPQISGGRETRKEALDEKLQLQTVLRSGSLPTGLEVVSTDIISPTLGSDFIKSAMYIGLFAGLSVFLIVFVRYRKLKVALPIFFVALSEVLLILGVAAINDGKIWLAILGINLIVVLLAWWKKKGVDMFSFLGAITIPLLGAGLSWTIDLPAIGGIIAAIGTGIDHQIIIADETIKGEARKIYGLKDKGSLLHNLRRSRHNGRSHVAINLFGSRICKRLCHHNNNRRLDWDFNNKASLRKNNRSHIKRARNSCRQSIIYILLFIEKLFQ